MLHGWNRLSRQPFPYKKRGALRLPNQELRLCAETLLRLTKRAGVTVVVAESCTAGRLATLLSDAEGAAQHFAGGFVTYTKEQKQRALAVSPTLLREKGAVCGEVARAMAEGALARSGAGLAAAITGVAGPEQDEDGNPVGRVCIAVARHGAPTRDLGRDYPDEGRDAIRGRAVADALKTMMEAFGSVSAGSASHRLHRATSSSR